AASARTTTTSCSPASARTNYPKTPTAGTWTCASLARSCTPGSGSASSAGWRGPAASRTSARRSRSPGHCTSCGRDTRPTLGLSRRRLRRPARGPVRAVLLQVGRLQVGRRDPHGVGRARAGPVVGDGRGAHHGLPSLLILARETRPRVAVAVALGAWVLATAAELVAAA